MLTAPGITIRFLTAQASVFDMTKGSLFPYVKNANVFICASDGLGEFFLNSYAVNSCAIGDTEVDARKIGKSLIRFRNAGKWMLLTEEASHTYPLNSSADDGYLSLASSNVTTIRHSGGAIVTFMDGHSKWFLAERIVGDGFQIGGGSATVLGGNCP